MTPFPTTALPDAAARASPLWQFIAGHMTAFERAIQLVIRRATGKSPGRDDDPVGDLIGETVRRALQSEHRFDSSQNPMPWLMSIALCALRDLQRAECRHSLRKSNADVNQLPAHEIEIDPRRDDIAGAMEKLPAKQRRVLQLRYMEGMSAEELAVALGLPTAGAARLCLFRAQQSLREKLGVNGGTHRE